MDESAKQQQKLIHRHLVELSSALLFFFSFNSFKTYSTVTVAAAQFSVTSPLSLLGNVDVRSLSGASSSSLTEAGGEEDDEQNCPPYSGTLTN